MKMVPRHQTQTFSEWLEVATHKLCAPAKERIGAEIEAHYAEAVEAHLQSGMQESAARAAAVAGLGDARVAAKGFRRQHLTEWQAESVKWMVKETRSVWVLLGCYFMSVVNLFQLWLEGSRLYRSPFMCAAIDLLALVAIPTASFILTRRKGRKVNLRLLILVRCVSGIIPGMALHNLFPISRSSITLLAHISAFSALPIQMIFLLCIWNKLRKTGGTENDQQRLENALL